MLLVVELVAWTDIRWTLACLMVPCVDKLELALVDMEMLVVEDCCS